MAKKKNYRLQMILDEKERKKVEAERRVSEAKDRVKEEENKYKKLIFQRENLIKSISECKKKRVTFSSEDAFKVEESIRLKNYIEGLEAEKGSLDGEIFRQKQKVEEARSFLRVQEENLINATKEFETFKKHKEKWIEKIKREEEKKEQKNLEEIGTLQFLKNFREGRKNGS